MSRLSAKVSASVRRHTLSRRAPLGDVDLPVHELISPLRLDVLVRVEMFRTIQEHPKATDVELLELVRGGDYEIWFRSVAMTRYEPGIAADDRRFEAEFAARVSRTIALWRSFTEHGFDERHPITLRRPGPRTRLPIGKPVERQRYLGDGCHRIAMMVAAGSRVVPAGRYRVEPVAVPEVLDNTSLLLPLLAPSEERYARFIAWGYDVPVAGTVADVLDAIRHRNPERFSEASAVVAADGYFAPTR
jgi:hypothetical protein